MKTVSFFFIRVVNNENQVASGMCQMFGTGFGRWRSRFICRLNMLFLCEKRISVSARMVKNRQICLTIGNAHKLRSDLFGVLPLFKLI
jgi:hypothetical protein